MEDKAEAAAKAEEEEDPIPAEKTSGGLFLNFKSHMKAVERCRRRST